MAEAQKFRDSAAVVFVRGQGDALEVFWVRRGDEVSFQPGFMAFIGGKVDAEDAGWAVPAGMDALEAATRACAVREAFEEAGVLVGVDGADPAVLAAARGELLAGRESFAALCERHGWRPDAGALAFAGRWQTPVFASVRFDTFFYVARLPDGQDARVIPGELAEGEWIRPIEALDRFRHGTVTFAAPILWTLIALAEGGPDLGRRLALGPERARSPVRRIELKWGVILHPMRTRPLPPATHTNAFLIGESELALVDPGSGDPAELEALFALTDHLADEGRRVHVIVATHHHPDHVGGLDACRRRFGVRVAGHPALAAHVPIDVALADGERLPLAGGIGDWDLRVLHVPGHSRDSLALWHERTRSLFCGDLIPGGPGSVIIDPPDGDMSDYLASLARVEALGEGTLFPAHGSPQGAMPRRARALITHREARERTVLAALGRDPRTPAELLPAAYADTKPDLWPLAERSLLAHLERLERTGLARRDGAGWCVAG